MSKYKSLGDYHYVDFEVPGSPYRYHVLDVIEKAKQFVKPKGVILEVGCGEGLILSKLAKVGFHVNGCDIDPHAVQLAIKKGNPVAYGDIGKFVGSRFDAVMALDVLEHVAEDQFSWTVHRMKAASDLIFVAVPDRHDEHGVRDFTMESLREMFLVWDCLHSETRHARHFIVMRKPQ